MLTRCTAESSRPKLGRVFSVCVLNPSFVLLFYQDFQVWVFLLLILFCCCYYFLSCVFVQNQILKHALFELNREYSFILPLKNMSAAGKSLLPIAGAENPIPDVLMCK